MQAIKSLVIGLGILIVVSLGLLAWGFYTTLGKSERTLAPPAPTGDAAVQSSAEQPSSPSTSAAPGFGTVRIDLPAGCTITEMHSEPGRLYVRTGPVGLCEQILVLDTASGRTLGSFVFRP